MVKAIANVKEIKVNILLHSVNMVADAPPFANITWVVSFIFSNFVLV